MLVLTLFVEVQETVASDKDGSSPEKMGQILYQIPDMDGASISYFSWGRGDESLDYYPGPDALAKSSLNQIFLHNNEL